MHKVPSAVGRRALLASSNISWLSRWAASVDCPANASKKTILDSRVRAVWTLRKPAFRAAMRTLTQGTQPPSRRTDSQKKRGPAPSRFELPWSWSLTSHAVCEPIFSQQSRGRESDQLCTPPQSHSRHTPPQTHAGRGFFLFLSFSLLLVASGSNLFSRCRKLLSPVATPLSCCNSLRLASTPNPSSRKRRLVAFGRVQKRKLHSFDTIIASHRSSRYSQALDGVMALPHGARCCQRSKFVPKD
jgi:hypothetical protein